MLTSNEKRTLCQLHICITFESIYQLSPASRYNMDLPLPQDAIFPLQMQQAHFENMVIDKSWPFSEFMDIYKPLHASALRDIQYKRSEFLHTEVLRCISILLGDCPSINSKWWNFISGYAMYIPDGPLKRAIKQWLMTKDKVMGIMWSMW